MIHPVLRRGIHLLLCISGVIFLILSLLTLIGLALIQLNGGEV